MAKSNGIDAIIADIRSKMVQGISNAEGLLAEDTLSHAQSFYAEFEPYYYERTYSLLSADALPVSVSGNTVSGGIVNTANASGGLHAGDKTGAGQFNGRLLSDPWTSSQVFEDSGYGNHGGLNEGGGSYVWNDHGDAEQTRINCIVDGMKQAGLPIK